MSACPVHLSYHPLCAYCQTRGTTRPEEADALEALARAALANIGGEVLRRAELARDRPGDDPLDRERWEKLSVAAELIGDVCGVPPAVALGREPVQHPAPRLDIGALLDRVARWFFAESTMTPEERLAILMGGLPLDVFGGETAVCQPETEHLTFDRTGYMLPCRCILAR